MNDACALIRAAAEYDDVQINFGIVLDESLDDEVKITVIATGFQRAGLPSVRQTSMSDQVLERATEPRFTAASEPQFTSEPIKIVDEPEIIEAEAQPVEEEVGVAVAASSSPSPAPEEPKNDLDLPAFMRRERRLFQ